MGKNSQSSGINTGMFYVFVIMLTLIVFGFQMAGGEFPVINPKITAPNPGKQTLVFQNDPDPKKPNLQLRTFTVKNECEGKIAVDFLIDESGSMAFGNKLTEEKNALKAFASKMNDESVIGMQFFSRGTRDAVPISKYKDVRSQVQNTINAIAPNGNTQTRDGMLLSKQKLSDVISQNKFPGYKYSFVLLTDGVPETSNPNETDCLATSIREDGNRRCFAKAQDPRGTPTDPANVGTEIKNLGVEVYSVNITSTEKSDVELGPYLEALLQNAASTPLSEHYFTSLNGEGLTRILDRVFGYICT